VKCSTETLTNYQLVMTKLNSQRASNFKLIHVLPSAVLLFTILLFSFNTSAQSSLLGSPAATISVSGIVTLPADQDLNGKYIIDISQFNFQTEEEMVAFFSDKSGDNYVIRPIAHENMAVLHLQCSKHPAWNCADWNSHLQAAMTANPIKL